MYHYNYNILMNYLHFDLYFSFNYVFFILVIHFTMENNLLKIY